MQRGNLGKVLLNGELTSIGATAVTSAFHLLRDDDGVDEYRNRKAGLYRPGNATGLADYWRWSEDLAPSTGAITVNTMADTTLGSESIYLMYDAADGFQRAFHPRTFLDALNRAMRKAYFDCMEPLSTRPNGTTQGDAGFQLSATTSWTESDADGGAATTFSKVSTSDSENVYPGRINGGRVLNGAANGYIRQRYSITEGANIRMWSLTRLDSGTAVELRAYDVTNSAEIESSDAVEHDQESWQFMYRTFSDSDCKILEIRHQGEGASDDFYIAGSWVYDTKRRMIVLDTTWETTYRMPKLARVELHNSTATNVWDAMSAELVEIDEGDDTYHFLISEPGANPYAVQIHNPSLFNSPLYIVGRRAYSDLTTFTLALSETTSCKLDLIEALTRVELFEPTGPLPDPRRHEAALSDLRTQEVQPRKSTPTRRIPDYFYGGLRS